VAQTLVKEALTAGEANSLKGAVERLDHATETLAARLVEKAIGEV